MTEREIEALRDFDLIQYHELAVIKYNRSGEDLRELDRLRRELLSRLSTWRRPKGFQGRLGV